MSQTILDSLIRPSSVILSQRTSSEATLSSKGFGRGLSGPIDISNEDIGQIMCLNFDKLIRTTPFKNSQTSLGSTSGGSYSQPNQQAEKSSPTTLETFKDDEDDRPRKQSDSSPFAFRSEIRKKSLFARYGTNRHRICSDVL